MAARKWDVEPTFSTAEAIILPFAEWPAENRTALVDFLLTAGKGTTFGPDSSELSAIATSIGEWVEGRNIQKALFRSWLGRVLQG